MLYNLITLQSTATGGDYSSIIMLIALIAIFYFLMIRPQQKKQKQIRQFRDALQKGDDVITAGGIYGKIKEVKDNVILLSVADGVTIKVDKGSVYPSATDAQNGAEAAK
jgi:preprotein translocase subunit YajC